MSKIHRRARREQKKRPYMTYKVFLVTAALLLLAMPCSGESSTTASQVAPAPNKKNARDVVACTRRAP